MDDAPVDKYFELIVWLPGSGAMHKLFKAPTLEAAIKIAESAYRGCPVEAAPTTAKPQLARSTTSPSVMQRLRYKRARKLTNRSENVRNSGTNP